MNKNIRIFILYTFISVILTYPMVFRLWSLPYTGSELIPPGSDIYYFPWGMWWFKYALVNSLNPFWTDYIFYPQGISLLFTLPHILWAVFAIPLQSFISLTAIYNLFFIASLILSAMGAFLLIEYLTKNSWAAFIGGVVFAFAPYHFVHIGHMSVFSTQWIPFFILFFIKMFNEGRWANAVLAGIFWAANCYTDLHYAVFLGVFVVIFFLYQLKYDKTHLLSTEYLKIFLIMVGVLIILAGPYGFSILKAALYSDININLPLQHSVSQSADILSFFIPSFMHPLFGQIVRPLYDHISTYNGQVLGGYIEITAFLGFTAIFLGIVGIRYYGFKRLKFWIIAAIFFFILTLGPVLKVNGLVRIPAEWLHLDRIAYRLEPNLDPLALEMMKKSVGIPLPYLIWHFIPFLSGAESATRFDIMFVMTWAVLCGFGVKAIIEQLKKRDSFPTGAYRIVCATVIILILFEYASFPIKMIEMPVSDFYKKIGKEGGDHALLILPILNKQSVTDLRSRVNEQLYGGLINASSKQAMYNQTVHHKKIVNGSTDRPVRNIRDFIDGTPLIRLLAYPEEISYKQERDIDITVLAKNKIKYVILQKKYLEQNEFDKLSLFLNNKFKQVFDDEEIAAYQTY